MHPPEKIVSFMIRFEGSVRRESEKSTMATIYRK